jgi:hypothetical protein
MRDCHITCDSPLVFLQQAGRIAELHALEAVQAERRRILGEHAGIIVTSSKPRRGDTHAEALVPLTLLNPPGGTP